MAWRSSPCAPVVAWGQRRSSSACEMSGPLSGLRVIEMAGIGPAPFAGMMLSDMGADVLRIDRKAAAGVDSFERVKAPNFIDRGRRSIAIDLKRAEGAALALDLIARAGIVIEGFRPGV